MSLLKFDEAMVKKLSDVFPNVVNAQEERRDTDGVDENAELRIPLVSVWRTGNPLNFGEFSNDSMVRRGFQYREVGLDNLRVRSVPVKINYQIDIISDVRTEVDDIFRELAMFLYESGVLDVQFDMGEGVEPLIRQFTLKVIDNNPGTDYGSFGDRGKLYKETINVEIPNAELLFTSMVKKVKSIPVRIYSIGRDGEHDDKSD